MIRTSRSIQVLVLAMALCAALTPPVRAATAYELKRDGRAALAEVRSESSKANIIADKAVAALVFPTVVKAGFILGGHGGDGVLLRNGKAIGYYNTSAVSYGLQAGVQKYSYVLFFMNDSAVDYLRRSDGWELGVGPSIVVVDAGTAKTMSTTTLKKDIYAFIFSQKGLMAGMGLQGTKITPYTPSR
ncbi:MAG TPA: lipid-binding SYLF domain-containing protein [Candidatus Methylacidiphilales bacterium]|jgi:lipid-binding SYLF domain-containing protein|nr:lipid-binding SYLF domain-containing protein [Candidatus Methylacidiphilales bacterium]